MRLTKETIDKIPFTEATKPPEPAKVKIYWDDDLRGFGLKVTSKKKIFIAQANIKGKTRRVTIGQYGPKTPDQARKDAKKEIGKIADGIDPAIERKKNKALDITLADVALSYIKARSLKDSTIADINKHLKSSFFDWQDRPVSKISRDKVMDRFQALSERSAAQANLAFRILRSLLNYARATYRDADDMPTLPENPVSVLSDAKIWNHIKPKSRRVPTEKVGVAWNYIQSLRDAINQTDITRAHADYMAFLMLTGCRKGEASKLTWDRVNIEERWWYLPDPKNKHSVRFPLSETACKILEDRPRTSQYVFPAKTKTGHIDDARRQFQKLSVEVGAEVSAHDMRRTFKAIASECKIELWRCKLLLNHQDSDVTINSYTETSDLRYLAQEINTIAEYIENQGSIAAAGNVVVFPVRKKEA